MAERKAVQIRPQPITRPAVQTSNAFAQELARFGQQMFEVSRRAMAQWVDDREREEIEKGAKAGYEGTFKPVEGSTRADQAYNRAGLDAYFERLKIQTADDVERIYDSNKHDPAKLETALDGWSTGIRKELNGSIPQLLPHFDAYFDRVSRPYRRQSAAEYERTQAQAALADGTDALTTMQRQHESRAFLSGNDNEAIADVSINRNDYLERLVSMGPREGFMLNGIQYEADARRAGAIDVTTIGKELASYDATIHGARVKGEFDRAFKAGRGERFVQNFTRSTKYVEQFGIAERDNLASWMRSQITLDRSMREAADRTLGAAVDAAIDSLTRGNVPGGLDSLRARAKGTDAGARLDLAVNNQDAITAFYRMTPQQQEEARQAQAASMKAMGPGADLEAYARETRAKSALIEGMEIAQRETAKGLQDDAYAFAIKVGTLPTPAPLIDQETGLLNERGLQERAVAAKQGSELYGVPMRGMTDGELVAFGELQARSDPVRRAANTAAIADTFEDGQALSMFEALDRKGFLVDAVAGSMMLDGVPELGQMIYQGDAILTPVGGKPAFKFPEADFDTYFSENASTLFALNPTAEVSVKEATKRAYVALLARTNRRPDEAVDADLVEQAFHGIMGGAPIKHSTGFFGHSVSISPPKRGATADDFDDWWDSIDGKALKAAGGMAGWDDDEAAAEYLRDNALPVEIRQGEYKLVIPGAGENLDLTKTVKGKAGGALVLRYQGR